MKGLAEEWREAGKVGDGRQKATKVSNLLFVCQSPEAKRIMVQVLVGG